MRNQNNVIIINGKQYDALTGRLLETAAPAIRTKALKSHPGIAMDGMVRSRAPRTDTNATPQQAKKIHAAQEKSKTLMRTAVKKPITHKFHAKAVPAKVEHRQNYSSQPSRTAHRDAARQARLPEIQKNPLISKYGAQSVSHPKTVTHKTSVLPVRQAPEHIAASSSAKVSSHKAPQGNQFEKAIKHAVSHQEKPPKKQPMHHNLADKLRISPRAVSLSSFALSLVLLSGFLTYQNVPNVAMHVAATRSGVKADLPDYKPSGFKIDGPIQYSTGEITIQYKSKTDERSFAVSQKKSAWNSETLLQNFINHNQHQYQTYQDKGRTIYIYDGSSATWIDGGVWFQIEGESALSSEQLLRIASSL